MKQIRGFRWRHALSFLVLSALFVAATPQGFAGDSGRSKTSSVTASYHYEPVPGKMVGVWPNTWSPDLMSQLHLQFGFSGIMIVDPAQQYQWALDAGFSPSSIMISVEPDFFTSIVDAYNAGFYYVDEPVEHNCSGSPSAGRFKSISDLDARHNYISSTRPSSAFVISGYKRCSHNIIASTHADLMMYSSYINWDRSGLPCCFFCMGWGDNLETAWLTGSDDQRNSWTDMQRVFGSKFSMTWIHGGGDEYDLLMGHATNLGLQAVWVYNGGPIDPVKLESFCQAAVTHGWLFRVEGPPLPIQLASFQAFPSLRGKVTLQWKTITEIDSYGFLVQRRREADEDFVELASGFVKGEGTSLIVHEYEFIDTTAFPGRWWYRLKMIDLDGSYSTSEPIAVDVTAESEKATLPAKYFLLQNYPNPFNPATVVTYQLPVASRVRLAVYDLLGREISVLLDEVKPAGVNSIRFSAANLTSGTYVCRLQTGSAVATQRMVLLK